MQRCHLGVAVCTASLALDVSFSQLAVIIGMLRVPNPSQEEIIQFLTGPNNFANKFGRRVSTSQVVSFPIEYRIHPLGL
jgi:hypothetical protein